MHTDLLGVMWFTVEAVHIILLICYSIRLNAAVIHNYIGPMCVRYKYSLEFEDSELELLYEKMGQTSVLLHHRGKEDESELVTSVTVVFSGDDQVINNFIM